MSDPEHGDSEPVKDLPGAAEFLTLGVTAGASVGLGIFLGVETDGWWHIAPWGLVGGLVLGLGLATVGAIQLVRRWL